MKKIFGMVEDGAQVWSILYVLYLKTIPKQNDP
jgi:hypothetical protein